MSALAQKRPLETDATIVILGGSFCPLHAGHLAALEAGRTQAQALDLTVVAGYLACAHDSHVRAKLGAESTAAEERFFLIVVLLSTSKKYRDAASETP